MTSMTYRGLCKFVDADGRAVSVKVTDSGHGGLEFVISVAEYHQLGCNPALEDLIVCGGKAPASETSS